MEYNLMKLVFVSITNWVNQNPFQLLKSILKMAMLLRLLFELEEKFIKISNLM